MYGQSLQGEWKNFRRIRVGDYRVIYTLGGEIKVILVVRIRHRRDVYRNHPPNF
ncbi:MAG: hypothetical protein DRP30_05935 [Thermotoga sp.]|nr:MAG: hypothetical protein DRP30_05935 [Thermotoga sp.]